MLVDVVHPLVKEAALGLVLLAVATFGLQDQIVAGFQTDDEVRAVFPNDTAIDIQHLEAEVIVLYPGFDLQVAVKFEGFRRLPGAVIDAEIDMAVRGVITGLAGVAGPWPPALRATST